jgi:hypothetical protein
MASDQKMAVGCVRAKRLGLRQSPAAFATGARGKAPEDWRSPRRFAPAVARPIFIVCGAACGMKSDPKAQFGHGLTLMKHGVKDQFLSIIIASFLEGLLGWVAG